MTSSVRKLDVFGIPVSLNLGRDSKFRSTFGFFMSIIFILLLAAYVIYQLFSILGVSDKIFTHVTSVEQIQPKDLFYAGNGRFKIGIGLQDKETAKRLKDAKVFGVRAKYDYRQLNNVTGQTESISFNLKVEPCKNDYFEGYLTDSTTEKKTSTTDFDLLICLSEDQATLPEDKQNLMITGQFDSTKQGKIVFSLERCKIDCKPAAEIDKILSRSNVAIYFINNGPNFNNLTHPYRRLLQTYYTSTDPKFTKLLDIAVKKVRVESDTGVILPGRYTQNYTALDRFSESISSENDQVIFRSQVQISTNMDVTIRSYKKLYTVFAEIGGYIKAFVIFAFLYRPFLKRLYYMEIINNLYRLERNRNLAEVEIEREREDRVKNMERSDSILFRTEDPDMKEIIEEKKREEMEARKSKMGEIENPNIEGLRQGLNAEELNRDSNANTEEDDENPQTYVLKYTWMDWIAIICPCLKTKKHKLLDRGRKIVENNTDITVIIRKLQEFELLKKMILSKDQEIIFNKLPKPNLLEIVESEEQEEAMKPIEEQLGAKSTDSVRGIDSDEGNVIHKIERQERERLSKKADEHRVVQSIYDKLKRERGQSTINDNLLTALEEYVVKNRESLAAEEEFKRKSVKRQPPPPVDETGNTFSRDDQNEML